VSIYIYWWLLDLALAIYTCRHLEANLKGSSFLSSLFFKISFFLFSMRNERNGDLEEFEGI